MRGRSNPVRRFDGDVAVVTGASSGIGRQLALDLAARGAVTVGVARRAELLDDLEQEMKRTSPRSATRRCDVADIGAYTSLLEGVHAEQGHIDILINNAGIDEPTAAQDGFTDTYRRIFEVNFFGLAAGTLAVLPNMTERGSGIIVLSSYSLRIPSSSIIKPSAVCSANCRSLSSTTFVVGVTASRHNSRPYESTTRTS